MSLEPLDPQLPELQIQRYVGPAPYWKLVDTERVADTGWSGVWVQTFSNGEPALGIKANHFWPQPPTIDGYEDKATELKDPGGGEKQPIAEFILDPRTSGFDAAGHGPHNFRVLPASDVVYGAGTRGNRHFQYRFVYELVESGSEPDPEPQPDGDYVTRAELYDLLDSLTEMLEDFMYNL